MEATLITSTEEFVAAHAYDEKNALKEAPTTFPCILVKKHAGGGLAGEYIQHNVHFFPQNMTSHGDYFNGFCAALPIEE